MVKRENKKKKCLILSVKMGYGHQRTAFCLRHLAVGEKIINADDYPGIPFVEKKIWDITRSFYEKISRLKDGSFLGKIVFSLFDKFQKIPDFYPKKRFLSPGFQLKQNFFLIKKGWGKRLISFLNSFEVSGTFLPLITTFFTPAFMAEFFGYKGEIFCVICDSDVSRSWVGLNPSESKIKYLVPTERVKERLTLYGVKKENIFLTGYPLPKELVGDEKLNVLKRDFSFRVLNLDPSGKYFNIYRSLLKNYLKKLPKRRRSFLTLMFCVGGAGAQKEKGIEIVDSLKKEIKKKRVRIILVAGTRREVKEYFQKHLKRVHLENEVEVLFEEDFQHYFQKFNQYLRKVDLLWTKPSELSFYSALGIPIIISPPIGSQEEKNREWLLKSGFGIDEEDPKYVSQWLFDWWKEGIFFKKALQGFLEGEKMGSFNIQKIVCGG